MDAHTAETLLEVAEQASAGATGPNAKASLEQLESRLDELLAAMAWFVEAGRTDEALRLANALYRFWITKQRFADGAASFERVLASPGGDDLLRGRAELNAGMMPFWMGDDARASERFGQALDDGSPAWRCAADLAGARWARPRGAAHGRARGPAARPRGARRERRRRRRGWAAPMRSISWASAPRSRATSSKLASG